MKNHFIRNFPLCAERYVISTIKRRNVDKFQLSAAGLLVARKCAFITGIILIIHRLF